MNDYLVLPTNFHEDDRAQRLLDVFALTKGQINVSYVNDINHIVAWHKHMIQTDMWICLKGSFKVGLIEHKPDGTFGKVTWEYLSDKRFRVLTIPTGWFHGYKALEPGSILMYYMTTKYDPNDEKRAKVGTFGESWETPNK